MRLHGNPLRRRHRDSRGQAMVEFAMVIPIFLLIFVAITEFSFLFTSYVSISFGSKDAVQMAATYGNTTGADAAILERIDNDIMAPANPRRITAVDIFLVNTATKDAQPVGGAVTTYIFDGGSHSFTKPDLTVIQLPFVRTVNGYREADRCNVNKGIGCVGGKTTIDTVGVRITYQYVWITPFPGMIGGGSSTGPLMSSVNVMRLEPVL